MSNAVLDESVSDEGSDFLSRKEAVNWLNRAGCKTTANTLAKYATVGGGPAYFKFGAKVVYTPKLLREWVNRRLSGPFNSTSDETA